MRFKNILLKHPILFLFIIIVIITFSLIIVSQITTDNSDTEELPVEEKIEVIPYKDYDWNHLYGYKKLRYYDEKYTSMFGIDVAAHQETIDWKKVAEDGVEFAYIRIGYRGAEEGKLNKDLEFENNYAGALKYGIKVGVYWYSQPISKEEAIEEAQYVISILDGRHLDLPIVYDFEETEFFDGTISRIHGMTRQSRTVMASSFLNEMKNNGYDCMIYTNLYWSKTYYDWSMLLDYPIWLAQYDTRWPVYDRPFVMWQYSEEGLINGIEKPVDLNIMFIRRNDQN